MWRSWFPQLGQKTDFCAAFGVGADVFGFSYVAGCGIFLFRVFRRGCFVRVFLRKTSITAITTITITRMIAAKNAGWLKIPVTPVEKVGFGVAVAGIAVGG